MFNVTGTGIICKEVEFKVTSGGTSVARATAVNNEEYKGEKKAYFTNLVLWGDRADKFAKEVKKGDLIDIEGILKHPVEEYQGRKLYKTEVTVMSWEVKKSFGSKEDKKDDKKDYKPKGKNTR